MTEPTDEQLKKIVKIVKDLQTDLKSMDDAIADLKAGQKSIEDLMRAIE